MIKNIAIGAVVLVGLFLGFGAYVGGTPEAKAREADRGPIEQCRKLQNDELQPIEIRRMARDTCDKMERDFQTKHGRPSRV